MITLLTDFGTVDYFVAAVKGSILSIDSDARIVDITHDIPPQDVENAAYILAACYRDFPRGTIHVAVVDPGVGSKRRAIIVRAGGYCFIGPDNGIFSHIYARETEIAVYHACHTEYFRNAVSSTFHGRDVFAPLAGWLSTGVSAAALGVIIDDYVNLEIARPLTREPGILDGMIIHIDRFGNCITNFTEQDFRPELNSRFKVAGAEVLRFGDHFDEFAVVPEPFGYVGSSGYWEIGIWRGSAAERLGIKKGSRVTAVT